MRFLAVVVLLLQLQPLAGSAICLHDAEVGRAECAMPHQERAVGGTLSAPGAATPAECSSMDYCAPSALSVVSLAEHFQIAWIVHRQPALSGRCLAPGDEPAPPLHPPRA
jgi:hypothetical protein